MITWKYAILVAASAGVLAVGCDTLEPGSYEAEVVVEGYLEAGAPLSEIRVSRTVALDTIYNSSSAGIDDAQVSVRLLDAAGEVVESHPYRSSPGQRGVYLPESILGQMPLVRPLQMYELFVDVPSESRPIRASTFVPDTFTTVRSGPDSVVYRSSEQYTFLVSPTEYPGRQNIFLFTTTALEGRVDQLTPFARRLLDNSELSIDDLREQSTPTLNEDNFQQVENGFLRIRFPWLGVSFFGANIIAVNTLDDNLYDFIRSQSVQQGGSTLPPGEIPNALEHVEGGRGVFGSYARSSLRIYVMRSM